MYQRNFRVTRQTAKNTDPTVLSCYAAYPDSEPRFIVQFIHGISEKKERYAYVMEHITKSGGIALIHDLRGHGESAASYDGLGYFGDFGYDYRTLCEDIDIVLAAMSVPHDPNEENPLITIDTRKEFVFPDLPRYLYGFSMGSLIAGIYAAKTPETLAGLMLGGLPRHQRLAPVALVGLGILELIFGEQHKSFIMNKLAFTSYNRKFKPEPEADGRFMWLSNDIENRILFADDPICAHKKTLNAFTCLVRLVRDFYRPSSWNMPRRDLPVYIMAGEFDPVLAGDKNALYTRKFLNDIGFNNVRITMYRGMRHEILRDFGREQVFYDIISFIESTIDAENDRLSGISAKLQPVL